MKRDTIFKTGSVVAVVAGLTLGGAAFANADQTATPSATPTATATGKPGPGAAHVPGQPRTRDADHAKDRAAHEAQLLSGATAVKVTQAATAKEPTAKLERVAADPAGGYTAHLLRTDGTHIVVHLDASFAVASDEAAPQRGPGGRKGPLRPGQPAQPGQTAQPGQPGQPGQAPSGTSSS